MAEFESWKQYWEFSHFVMRKARHLLDAKNQRFLEAVVETSAKRKASIQKGAVLWRAQLGNDWRTERVLDEKREEIDAFDVENPFSPDRMTPLQDRANEGRVNPKGIPCLYFSTDRDTAMAETRPWIGSHVSVAQFVMLRDLSVVDCSSDSARRGVVVFGEDREPEPAKREELVWGSINRAFSEPVTRIDDVAEYAPTQVLAEAFRNAGRTTKNGSITIEVFKARRSVHYNPQYLVVRGKGTIYPGRVSANRAINPEKQNIAPVAVSAHR